MQKQHIESQRNNMRQNSLSLDSKIDDTQIATTIALRRKENC